MQTEDDITPERLLEAEWLSVSAIREISGLAFRRPEPPTYRNSLVIGEELYPALFHRDRSLLWRKQESATAKLYRQMAEKRSKMVKKDVAALDLIDEVIHQHEEMLEVDKGQNANHIKGCHPESCVKRNAPKR